jgi:hypothetical protein
MTVKIGAGEGRMQAIESRIAIVFGRYCLTIAVLVVISVLKPDTASALPSFARQTGQPCATCHTALPELTPFGRQFKLGGYTAGGTRCGDAGTAGSAENNGIQIPISVMVIPSFSHIKKDLPEPPSQFVGSNNDLMVSDSSVFVAGQLYCNLGAFVQTTYDRPSNKIFLDNTDIRYADTIRLGGLDVLYGITANNSPTVQDVWNSTPVWSFPFTSSPIGPGPSAATMIEDTFAGRVAGSGGYLWINRTFYAELTGYGSLDNRTLTNLGVGPGGPQIDGIAPYWRLAMEKTWDQNSLMVGTFGMMANVLPETGMSGPTDKFTDIALDTQYQYIGETHAFTARASYIWENQNLDATFGVAGLADKNNEELRSFKASASYIYDRTISVTGGYFDIRGTADSQIYGNFNGTNSPNSNGWTADIAYLPFSHGGPSAWPWLNARIGVSYNHYDKLDGCVSNCDDTGRSASDNDTTYVYTWIAF